MWSDNDTRVDYLNFRCVAETAAELIVQADGAPLSMGVSGGWGVGKSSMLNLISDSLQIRDTDKNYLFISFNAWLYQGYDDARAALLEEIATKLVERAAGNETALEKAKVLLGKVNWLRVAGLTATSGIALALGLPPVGILGGLWKAVRGVTDGDVTEEDLEQLESSGKGAVREGKGVFRKGKEPTPPEQIHALRQHFEETLEATGTTLVVFIDDLDRCLPSTAISTLEAIRLFLFLPRTAFVIAADDKMIREAVRTHFKEIKLDDDLVTNYFDKLIQVPLRVPPLGTQEVRAYLMLLFLKKAGLADGRMEEIREKVCQRLSESWSGKRVDLKFVTEVAGAIDDDARANLALADRLAPLMTTAEQIKGNPRLIKRFLNTLRIRMSVAESQGVAVDESALAKVLLFERCASEDASRRLVSAVNDGSEGKPAFLAEWERQARSGEQIVAPDPGWETPFVKGWLALEPQLAPLDLRAVIYVSRETLPIVTAADQMSTDAQQLLEALVQLEGPSNAFAAQLRALPGRDRSLMVERLMVRARQEQSWGRPPVLWAFLAFFDAAPEMAPPFVAFLMDVDATRLGAGIVPTLSDVAWARPVLDAWRTRSDLPGPVKKALQALDAKAKAVAKDA